MKTYKKNTIQNTRLCINTSTQGESIETKLERIITNKEAITDGAPIIFQERKEGIGAAYNIRTDRFEIAAEAMDIQHKSTIAKRENVGKVVDINGKPESADATLELGNSNENNQ